MDNQVTLFEQKNMMAFLELRNLANEVKAKEERMEAIKETIKKGMVEHGITSISNDYVTISHVPANPGKPKLDETAWKAEDPDGYREVFNKYNKMSGQKRGYIRIVTK